MVLVVKNPSANTGDLRDAGSIPGSERSPREGNGNPLQYSCLENSMDRGGWRATVQGAAKSDLTKRLTDCFRNQHHNIANKLTHPHPHEACTHGCGSGDLT